MESNRSFSQLLKKLISRITPERVPTGECALPRNEGEASRYGDPNPPLPPPDLRERVSAVPDADTFLVVGRRVYDNVKEMLEWNGINIDDCKSILDFGCGCGRLLRFFRPNGGFIAGCDIDEEAISWCRKNLSNVNRLVVNDPWPPLPFEDATFDLICAISVFTHLPQEMERAWLVELHRLMRVEGILIASVMGESALAAEVSDVSLRERFHKYGVCRSSVYPPGGLFPDFYQITYHSREYIHAHWSQYFKITGYHEREVNYHHDAVVCRKR